MLGDASLEAIPVPAHEVSRTLPAFVQFQPQNIVSEAWHARKDLELQVLENGIAPGALGQLTWSNASLHQTRCRAMRLFLWSDALAETPNVMLTLFSLLFSSGAEDGLMCFPASDNKTAGVFGFDLDSLQYSNLLYFDILKNTFQASSMSFFNRCKHCSATY